MSKRDEIIAVIKQCAEKLGRAPSQAEFRRACTISWHQVYKHFRGMRAAVRAAGLEPGPRGGPLNESALVLDWARVVRALGRLPYRTEYDRMGKHHSVTLHARIGWSQMTHRFVLLVREFHLEAEWGDVVEIVCRKYSLLRQLASSNWQIAKPFTAENAKDAERNRFAADPLHAGAGGGGLHSVANQDQVSREFTRKGASQGMRLGRVVAAVLAMQILMAARSAQLSAASIQAKAFTAKNAETAKRREAETEGHATVQRSMRSGELVVYGAPLRLAAMAHAPTNEAGVIFLFGVMAADLGFRVERLQSGFPDCEAKREVAPGKWEWVRIEFEFESRNFREHRHDPEGCDVIVCWRHNWAECPARIEVIELSKLVG